MFSAPDKAGCLKELSETLPSDADIKRQQAPHSLKAEQVFSGDSEQGGKGQWLTTDGALSDLLFSTQSPISRNEAKLILVGGTARELHKLTTARYISGKAPQPTVSIRTEE